MRSEFRLLYYREQGMGKQLAFHGRTMRFLGLLALRNLPLFFSPIGVSPFPLALNVF